MTFVNFLMITNEKLYPDVFMEIISLLSKNKTIFNVCYSEVEI